MINRLAYLCALACLVLPNVGRAQGTQSAAPAAAAPAQAGLLPQVPDLSSYLAIDSVSPGSIEASPDSPGTYLPLTVEMHNVAAKAITAYRMVITLQYPDGSSSTAALMEDCSYTIAEMKTPGVLPIPNSTLNPAETHVITQRVRLAQDWQMPVRFTPAVTMLVFGDRTGIGDPKAIAMVGGARRQMRRELAALIAQVNDAESAPDPGRRYAELMSAARSDGVRHAGLGASLTRLELFSKLRGTPQFALMRRVDAATLVAFEDSLLPTGDERQEKQ